MTTNDDIQKQLSRFAQELKSIEPSFGLKAAILTPIERLQKELKSAGGNSIQELIKASAPFDFNQNTPFQTTIVEALRSMQEGAQSLKDFIQPFNDFQTQLACAAQVVVQPFVQVLQAAEQIQTEIRKAFEPLQRIRDAFNAFSPEESAALQRAFAAFGDKLRLQWDITERPIFRLFARLGLAGLETHLTRSELLYVLKLSKEKGRKAVPEYIFRKLRRANYKMLNQVVRGWWRVPYMEKRKKTIRAAIGAHKNHQFELAIPTLLPLIDGLAAEIMIGVPNLTKKASYTKDAVTMYNAAEAEVWSECVEQIVSSLMYKGYNFRTAKRPPSSVNRHGILHGMTINYGSELNSYRVILLLDVMVHIAATKP